MRIAVHVTPKSGRDEVAGWHGGELVSPGHGRARRRQGERRRMRAAGARSLGVPKIPVRVVRGEIGAPQADRGRRVLTAEDVARAFGEPPDGLF